VPPKLSEPSVRLTRPASSTHWVPPGISLEATFVNFWNNGHSISGNFENHFVANAYPKRPPHGNRQSQPMFACQFRLTSYFHVRINVCFVTAQDLLSGIQSAPSIFCHRRFESNLKILPEL
jgi:hypothetical protein